MKGMLRIPESGRLSVQFNAFRSNGFSRFELLTTVVLIGVLAAVLLDYSLRYQERAEKAVMEATVAHIRSGLRVRIAELMIAERTAEIGNLVTENPVNWLASPPGNYIGSIRPSYQKDIPAGSWYFDAISRELVYLPKLHRFLNAKNAENNGVRFQVVAKKRSVSTTGNLQYEGVEFRQITKYTWF